MLGIHQTFENPMYGIIEVAKTLQSDTLQIFTRNNRNCKQRSLSDLEISDFNRMLLLSSVQKIVCHAPYALNLCSDEYSMQSRVLSILNDDLRFMDRLCGSMVYVVHPGSRKDLTHEEALCNLFDVIDKVSENLHNVSLAIEIMAGAGTQFMSSYEDIAKFIARYEPTGKVGLCFDTCHVYGAGLNLENLYRQIKDWVKVVHLNNSMCEFGSRKDRHAPIEQGCIDAQRLVDFYKTCSANKELPIILEVPDDYLEHDLHLLQNI